MLGPVAATPPGPGRLAFVSVRLGRPTLTSIWTLLALSAAVAAPALYALWLRPQLLTWGPPQTRPPVLTAGDELIPTPTLNNHGTILPALSERVWPGWCRWRRPRRLVQLGRLDTALVIQPVAGAAQRFRWSVWDADTERAPAPADDKPPPGNGVKD